MDIKILIQVLDGVFSGVLIISSWVASKRNEGMRDSLQINVVNLLVSFVFAWIALYLGIYGTALRQTSFGVLAIRNLYVRQKLKKENGRA